MELYRSPRSLAQLGVTEQLDSGIYLLYKKKNCQNITTLCPIVKALFMQPKQNVLTLFTQSCITSFDSFSTLLETVKLSPFPSATSLWSYEGCRGLLMQSLTIQDKNWFPQLVFRSHSNKCLPDKTLGTREQRPELHCSFQGLCLCSEPSLIIRGTPKRNSLFKFSPSPSLPSPALSFLLDGYLPPCCKQTGYSAVENGFKPLPGVYGRKTLTSFAVKGD